MEQSGLISFSSSRCAYTELSALWWAGLPTAYPLFKARMLRAYPYARNYIESLLPVGFASVDAGITGATTTLASTTANLASNPQHWARRARQWGRVTTSSPIHRTLYENALYEAAELLFNAWRDSDAKRGWMVVEPEPCAMYGAPALFKRARDLANLMPNIVVSVPVSEMGCEVIEELVATGHAVNASLCFSVAQVHAALAAIGRGRQRALSHGVNTERTRHLISILPGALVQTPGFIAQAEQVGVRLSAREQRWASIALYRWLCAAMLGNGESISVMVCGNDALSSWMSLDARAIGASQAIPILHSLDEQQFEALIAQCGMAGQSRLEAEGPVPPLVMERLLRIPGFRQVIGAQALSRGCFSRHPVFLEATQQSLRAYTRLLDFARQLNPPLLNEYPRLNRLSEIFRQ